MLVRTTTGFASSKMGELNETVWNEEKLTELFGYPSKYDEGNKTTTE